MASIEEAKEIIKSTPISSIVTYYHPINKRGANFEGVCPFHADTNPSLKLNDSKGIYKCFVCGAAGDAIKFVQDKSNLDFIDAIKDIAGQLGLTIEDNFKKNKDPKYDMALRVLSASNKIYRKVATEINPKNFTDFLTSRNISQESLENFQIGYAPGKNALTNYLAKLPAEQKDFAINTAAQIGIIRPDRNGNGHYDFYRDRVTFPIHDHGGKIRGYSSRAVLPDQKPKYLNSGESFIFDKGNILYGFHLAKSQIREKDCVIIVEGNMDAIMLHQFGFKNSVATQGVALGQSSIKLLSNMTKNIYLAMDSDPAGLAAMQKINHALLEQNLIAKYLDFAPCKDPDEFLNEYGSLELQKLIDCAPTFIDFKISTLITDPIPSHTDKKLDILKSVFKLLSPLGQNLLAMEKVIQCAKSLGLKSNNEDITSEYKNFLEQGANKITPDYKKQKTNAPIPSQVPDSRSETSHIMPSEVPIINTVELSKAELVLLETLLTHPECSQNEQIIEILDLIDHFEVKRIVQWLAKIYLEIDETDYPLFIQEKLKEALPDQIKRVMSSSLFQYDSLKLNEKIREKMMSDLLKKLKVETLITERNKLRVTQKNCDTDEESLKIITEIQKVEQQLSELRNK